MTFSFTVDVLFAIALAGGVLALVDGIVGSRGRGSIRAVIEIIVAALFVLSLFFTGIPFGQLALATAAIVLLIIRLVMRGRRRGGLALTVVALLLLVLWVLLVQNWLLIPGLNA